MQHVARGLSLLAAVMVTNACVLHGSGRNTAYAVNGAAVATGVIAVAASLARSCDQSSSQTGNVGQDFVNAVDDSAKEFGCESATRATAIAGVILLAAGGMGFAANAAANDDPEDSPISLAGPPGSCAAKIDVWRRERDLARKNLLLARLGECGDQVYGGAKPGG